MGVGVSGGVGIYVGIHVCIYPGVSVVDIYAGIHVCIYTGISLGVGIVGLVLRLVFMLNLY